MWSSRNKRRLRSRANWMPRLICSLIRERLFLEERMTLPLGMPRSSRRSSVITNPTICSMLLVIRSVSIFYRLLRKDSMVGCGLVPMDISVSLDIVFQRVTFLSRTNQRPNQSLIMRTLSWLRRLTKRGINLGPN